jgi:hypothetical protein
MDEKSSRVWRVKRVRPIKTPRVMRTACRTCGSAFRAMESGVIGSMITR